MSPQSDDKPHRKSSEAQSTEEAEKALKDSAKASILLGSVLIGGVTILILGAVGGLIGTALVEGLGWHNLGPLATWFAAALTLAAVIVALESSRRSVQAIDEARQRAEDDRRFAINRQSALAVADMWAALLAIRPAFESAVDAMSRLEWNVANRGLLPDPKEPIEHAITAASGAIFFARSVIEAGPVLDWVDKINGLFTEFRAEWNTASQSQPRPPQLRQINLALAEIEFSEDLAVGLARLYLPMSLTQANRIEQDVEAIARERRMLERHHSQGWEHERIRVETTWRM